jgi:hypothetical protein
MILLNVVHFSRTISRQNFMVPRWRWKLCIHLRSLNVRHFWNGWRYRNKKYGVEVTFNDMDRQTVRDRQTDRQTGDLITLTILFKESRLKKRLEKTKIMLWKTCNKFRIRFIQGDTENIQSFKAIKCNMSKKVQEFKAK